MKLPQQAFDYDAWLIDLDGTLYAATGVKAAMALELMFAGPATIKIIRQFRKEHEHVRNIEESSANSPYQAQIQRTADALQLPVEDVEGVILDWMFDRPGKWIRLFRRRGLLANIEQFRAKGGLTALVSDYPATKKLRAMYAHFLFDEVVANGEPGGPSQLKPSPEGLLEAARRLRMSPERCLVLGDRPDADGEAAEAAGMSFQLIR